MNQDLLQKFVEIDERQRELKAELKEVTSEREALQAEMLEEMSNSDMTSLVVGGRNYYVHNRVSVSLKPEVDSQTAEYFLRSHGLEYLMPRKIDSQKLSSIVSEAVKDGTVTEQFGPIDEVFNIHQIVSIRSRKKA